jgi:hypothetical protein
MTTRRSKEYIVNLIEATRDPERYGLKSRPDPLRRLAARHDLSGPGAKAHAFFAGRGYVTPAGREVGGDGRAAPPRRGDL